MQFPLHLAYIVTFNKSQYQTLVKVMLDIMSPPSFTHEQLYVALSRVRDSKNIRAYLTSEQLDPSDHSCTGFMPTVNNTVYQDVLILNSQKNSHMHFVKIPMLNMIVTSLMYGRYFFVEEADVSKSFQLCGIR
jgi:hypothetical protein